MRHGIYIIALTTWASVAWADAGEALGGIAAIVDAGAPIAVAGVQASADRAIAGINADAAVKMTQITADTTKYLADNQKDIALYQAESAQQINLDNNRFVTERLAMQLGALSAARREAQQFEMLKLQVEQNFNQQRIDLAKQQAANQVMIAQKQLALQGSIAGMTGSFQYGNSKLTLTGARSVGQAIGQANPVPTPTPDENARVQTSSIATTSTAPKTIVRQQNPRQPLPAKRPANAVATAPRALQAQPAAPRASVVPARLLASVGGPRGNRGAASPGAARSFNAATAGVRGAISGVARGSFPGSPQRIANTPTAPRSLALRYPGRPHATGDAIASTTVSSGTGEAGTADVGGHAGHSARVAAD